MRPIPSYDNSIHNTNTPSDYDGYRVDNVAMMSTDRFIVTVSYTDTDADMMFVDGYEFDTQEEMNEYIKSWRNYQWKPRSMT